MFLQTSISDIFSCSDCLGCGASSVRRKSEFITISKPGSICILNHDIAECIISMHNGKFKMANVYKADYHAESLLLFQVYFPVLGRLWMNPVQPTIVVFHLLWWF